MDVFVCCAAASDGIQPSVRSRGGAYVHKTCYSLCVRAAVGVDVRSNFDSYRALGGAVQKRILISLRRMQTRGRALSFKRNASQAHRPLYRRGKILWASSAYRWMKHIITIPEGSSLLAVSRGND